MKRKKTNYFYSLEFLQTKRTKNMEKRDEGNKWLSEIVL